VSRPQTEDGLFVEESFQLLSMVYCGSQRGWKPLLRLRHDLSIGSFLLEAELAAGSVDVVTLFDA
jgi:hypothetical protein